LGHKNDTDNPAAVIFDCGCLINSVYQFDFQGFMVESDHNFRRFAYRRLKNAHYPHF
jgi:hypothetical protein